MGFALRPGGSGGGGGGGGGGGDGPVTVTTKSVSMDRSEGVGVASNVDIARADSFYDTTIDMPATANIADTDMFEFSVQFRQRASNPTHESIFVSGKDWKAMVALTTTQQSQGSFSTASSRKTVTFFLRRTSASGGQAQQNLFFAKGADGVSLYIGDNNNAFDANVQVWKVGLASETLVTAVAGGGFPEAEGSTFSQSLSANQFRDTGIALPADGWIYLVGSAVDGRSFSIRIPVTVITAKSASTALTAPNAINSLHYVIGNGATHTVRFGHTAAGNLLIGSGTASVATLNAYV